MLVCTDAKRVEGGCDDGEEILYTSLGNFKSSKWCDTSPPFLWENKNYVKWHATCCIYIDIPNYAGSFSCNPRFNLDRRTYPDNKKTGILPAYARVVGCARLKIAVTQYFPAAWLQSTLHASRLRQEGAGVRYLARTGSSQVLNIVDNDALFTFTSEKATGRTAFATAARCL